MGKQLLEVLWSLLAPLKRSERIHASAHMWPTSQTGPQTVVVSVQQAVQDPGEQGDVGIEGVGRGVGAH